MTPSIHGQKIQTFKMRINGDKKLGNIYKFVYFYETEKNVKNWNKSEITHTSKKYWN